LNKTLIIEFWRSELLDSRCIVIHERIWPDFKSLIESTGIKIEEIELSSPFGCVADYHRAREVMDAVYEIQNQKRQEGESILPAIESLIDKYAALK
jgi:hypothetical protein